MRLEKQKDSHQVKTPGGLQKAVFAGDREGVREALRGLPGGAISSRDINCSLEILCGSDLLRLECLEELLSYDSGSLARSFKTYPGLGFMACRSQSDVKEKLSLLAAAGVGFDDVWDGQSVLHMLCEAARATVESVRLLVAYGVDLNQLDSKGRSALDLAFREESLDVIVELAALGGSFDPGYCKKWVGIRADKEMMEFLGALIERTTLDQLTPAKISRASMSRTI